MSHAEVLLDEPPDQHHRFPRPDVRTSALQLALVGGCFDPLVSTGVTFGSKVVVRCGDGYSKVDQMFDFAQPAQDPRIPTDPAWPFVPDSDPLSDPDAPPLAVVAEPDLLVHPYE
jgi:hypothetical protein